MIIGFSGKAGAGKDTAGKIATKLLGKIYKGISIMKFADKLKDSIELKFPNSYNKELWEKSGAEYRDGIIPSLGISRRQLLIQEAMALREIHPDYWVNALFEQYVPDYFGSNYLNFDFPTKLTHAQYKFWDENPDKRDGQQSPCFVDMVNPKWIITDLRFPNEMKAIKDRGGLVIRVERNGISEIDSYSETALDYAVRRGEFDLVSQNNSDLKTLEAQLLSFFESRGFILPPFFYE